MSNYLFFWGHKGTNPKACLSQWFPAEFRIHGNTYATAEHYMMYRKAQIFEPDNSSLLHKILNANSPDLAKSLGRQVKNFDKQEWDRVKTDIVTFANLQKFSDNEELGSYLVSTEGKILVEASPYDRIWGIGYDQDNALDNIDDWGENLLGECLMRVRTLIKSAHKWRRQ